MNFVTCCVWFVSKDNDIITLHFSRDTHDITVTLQFSRNNHICGHMWAMSHLLRDNHICGHMWAMTHLSKDIARLLSTFWREIITYARGKVPTSWAAMCDNTVMTLVTSDYVMDALVWWLTRGRRSSLVTTVSDYVMDVLVWWQLLLVCILVTSDCCHWREVEGVLRWQLSLVCILVTSDCCHHTYIYSWPVYISSIRLRRELSLVSTRVTTVTRLVTSIHISAHGGDHT